MSAKIFFSLAIIFIFAFSCTGPRHQQDREVDQGSRGGSGSALTAIITSEEDIIVITPSEAPVAGVASVSGKLSAANTPSSYYYRIINSNGVECRPWKEATGEVNIPVPDCADDLLYVATNTIPSNEGANIFPIEVERPGVVGRFIEPDGELVEPSLQDIRILAEGGRLGFIVGSQMVEAAPDVQDFLSQYLLPKPLRMEPSGAGSFTTFAPNLDWVFSFFDIDIFRDGTGPVTFVREIPTSGSVWAPPRWGSHGEITFITEKPDGFYDANTYKPESQDTIVTPLLINPNDVGIDPYGIEMLRVVDISGGGPQYFPTKADWEPYMSPEMEALVIVVELLGAPSNSAYKLTSEGFELVEFEKLSLPEWGNESMSLGPINEENGTWSTTELLALTQIRDNLYYGVYDVESGNIIIYKDSGDNTLPNPIMAFTQAITPKPTLWGIYGKGENVVVSIGYYNQLIGATVSALFIPTSNIERPHPIYQTNNTSIKVLGVANEFVAFVVGDSSGDRIELVGASGAIMIYSFNAKSSNKLLEVVSVSDNAQLILNVDACMIVAYESPVTGSTNLMNISHSGGSILATLLERITNTWEFDHRTYIELSNLYDGSKTYYTVSCEGGIQEISTITW